MKILHINTIDTGGAGKAAIRLHLLLLQNGIDSKILFLKRSGKENIREAYYFEDIYRSGLIFKFLFRLNSFFNRRFTFYKPGLYFNGPESLFNISKHPLYRSADVIHLHWVVKFLDWKKVFRNKSKKYVWTFHDMNPFTGGEHYQTGYHGEFSQVSLRNIRVKTKAVTGCNITVVSPSQWLATLAKRSEVFKSFEIRMIRNPVDTNTFNIVERTEIRKKYGLPEDKKIILFVAENANDERKGYRLLTDALNKLGNKDHLHLAVIGKKAALPQGIPSTLLGSINEEATMAELYNAADLFVIPSLEDNLPNTVSEALLCGTPVAGNAAGGIPEMVHNGLNGEVSASVTQLDEAIKTALDTVYQKQAVRTLALSELDPDLLLKQFISVYKTGGN